MKTSMYGYITIFEEQTTLVKTGKLLSYNVKVARDIRDKKQKSQYTFNAAEKLKALALAFQIHNEKKTANIVFNNISL